MRRGTASRRAARDTMPGIATTTTIIIISSSSSSSRLAPYTLVNGEFARVKQQTSQMRF